MHKAFMREVTDDSFLQVEDVAILNGVETGTTLEAGAQVKRVR